MNCPHCGKPAAPVTDSCASCGTPLHDRPHDGPAYSNEEKPPPVASQGKPDARKLLRGCFLAAVLITLCTLGGAFLLSAFVR